MASFGAPSHLTPNIPSQSLHPSIPPSPTGGGDGVRVGTMDWQRDAQLLGADHSPALSVRLSHKINRLRRGWVCAGAGLFFPREHHRGPASQQLHPCIPHRSMAPAGPAPATAPGMLHIGMQGGKDDAAPPSQILTLGGKSARV